MNNKLYKKNKGITLVALIITIVVLMIITGITAKIIYEHNIIDESKDLNKKLEQQEDEQQSITNMVRNLYKPENSV